MRRFILIIAILSLAVSFVFPRIITTDKAGRFGMNLEAGYGVLRGGWVEDSFVGGLSLAVGMNFGLTSHIGLVSYFEYNRPRPTEEVRYKTEDASFRIYSFRGGVRFDFLPAREIVPYLEGTVGFYHNRFNFPEITETRNRAGFELRGGFEIFLMKRWSISISLGVNRYFSGIDGGLNLVGDGGTAIVYPVRFSIGYYF
jgi:hypothetical protein